jgi:hypothetical protein
MHKEEDRPARRAGAALPHGTVSDSYGLLLCYLLQCFVTGECVDEGRLARQGQAQAQHRCPF